MSDHVQGRWCADLHCSRCYSAATWQDSELERVRAYAGPLTEAAKAVMQAWNVGSFEQQRQAIIALDIALATKNPAECMHETNHEPGSLSPRFVKGDGSFEDWYEGYFAGCVRPDGRTTEMLRHAFEGARECVHETNQQPARVRHWAFKDGEPDCMIVSFTRALEWQEAEAIPRALVDALLRHQSCTKPEGEQ